MRSKLNDDAVIATIADTLDDGGSRSLTEVIYRLRHKRRPPLKIGNEAITQDVIFCVRAVLDGQYPTLLEAMERRMSWRHAQFMKRLASKPTIARTPRQVAAYVHEQDPTGVTFGAEPEIRKIVLTALQLDFHLDVTPPEPGRFPQTGLLHVWAGTSGDHGRIQRGVRMSVLLSKDGRLLRAERTDIDALAELGPDGVKPTLELARIRDWLKISAEIPSLDAESLPKLAKAPIPTKWAQIPQHPGLAVRPSLDVPDRTWDPT